MKSLYQATIEKNKVPKQYIMVHPEHTSSLVFSSCGGLVGTVLFGGKTYDAALIDLLCDGWVVMEKSNLPWISK